MFGTVNGVNRLYSSFAQAQASGAVESHGVLLGRLTFQSGIVGPADARVTYTPPDEEESVRTSLSILFVAIAIAVLASAVSTSARQRDVWEYIINHSDSVGGLNQLGQQGWEAVAVYTPPNSGSLQILMKRRKN